MNSKQLVPVNDFMGEVINLMHSVVDFGTKQNPTYSVNSNGSIDIDGCSLSTGNHPCNDVYTYPDPIWIGGPWRRRSSDWTVVDIFSNITVTPWDGIPNFPPVNVEVNKDTKDIRYTFALAGIKQSRVHVSFSEDKMILLIDKEEKKENEEWSYLKQKIKSSVAGEYEYAVPASKYDIRKAKHNWEDGLLTITIPLLEDQKPHKLF